MSENPPAAAGKHYPLGKLRFEHQPDGRWGVSDGMLGVGGHRTPLGAWLALRRWRVQAATLGPASAPESPTDAPTAPTRPADTHQPHNGQENT